MTATTRVYTSPLTHRIARAAGDIGRRPAASLVGALVLDEDGQPVEVVAPFASRTAATAWLTLHGIPAARYQLLPARLPVMAYRQPGHDDEDTAPEPNEDSTG